MKYLFILLISFNLSAQDWQFKRDKQLHAGVGFVMGAGLSQLMISSNLGYSDFEVILAPVIPIAFVAGGKELYDSTFGSGRAYIEDIGYTMIGGLIGSFATWGVNKYITNRKNKEKLKL